MLRLALGHAAQVQRLSIDDLRAAAPEWNRYVAETPGIDVWCSSTDWVLPLFDTWGQAPAVILRDPALGWAAFGWADLTEGTHSHSHGRALVGLDPVWGFAATMVGPQPSALAEAVAGALDDIVDWDAVFLTGLVPGTPMDQAVVEAFGRRHRLFAGPESPRCVADLSSGVEAWWARRSERFRRNLRRARELAFTSGVTMHVMDQEDPDVVMDRIATIEDTSWKGMEGSGLSEERMASAYRAIAHRLSADGRMRACIATHNDIDVGFILGGVREATYRGLQISYAATARHLSIGHLLQDHEVARVATDGITRYDLGMDLEYKQRWADTTELTRTLVAVR